MRKYLGSRARDYVDYQMHDRSQEDVAGFMGVF